MSTNATTEPETTREQPCEHPDCWETSNTRTVQHSTGARPVTLCRRHRKHHLGVTS
jgi:hypothetical protein